MNKRFFTLMAAVLLAGAPLCNEAFAEYYQPVSVTTSTKLANGLKFVIKTGTGTLTDAAGRPADAYATVTAGAAGTVVLGTDAVYDKATTAVFEVRNYSSATRTFELYVDSKKVFDSSEANSVFYATNGSATVDDLSFNEIDVAEFGVSSATSLVRGATPMFVQVLMDEADLNSNLSNNGFKFSFPGVAVQPDENLFAAQMVAIPAATVKTVWTAAPASGMYFVLADAAGLKLKSDVTADNLKAATFIVVNPNKNFGITGLSADNGEGFDFTTVKGEKLKSANKPADGEIAYDNGVFWVKESDYLNASDELDITVIPKVVKDANNLTATVPTQYVGVYSLTTGGLKSYVTTKSTPTSLAKASTGGNTYVAAADVLKASKEAAK